jgi:hypothetical protein
MLLITRSSSITLFSCQQKSKGRGVNEPDAAFIAAPNSPHEEDFLPCYHHPNDSQDFTREALDDAVVVV